MSAPPPDPHAPDFLRQHRPFVQFWLARILYGGGSQIKDVAVGWQVYQLTGSALDLGLVGLIQFLPRILLTAIAGDLADRHDRRWLTVAAQLVQTAGLAVLAVASAAGFVNRELIFGVVLVLGAAQTFQMPASASLLPALVPAAALPRALALSASAMQAATIIAPALGGFLYLLGAPVVYSLTALLLALSSIFMMRLPDVHVERVLSGSAWQRFVAGIRFIRGQGIVFGAMSLDLFAVLFGGATALLPIIAHEVLHTGAWGLGLLRSGPAIGALAMALWLARNPLRHSVGRILYGAVAAYGLSIIAFGLSSNLWLSVFFLAIGGATDMISMVIRQSLVQLQTPDEMRGRVSAVNSIFVGASNQLGEFESGLTAAWFGAVPSVLIGGAATVLVVALWTRLFPQLGRTESLHGRPPA